MAVGARCETWVLAGVAYRRGHNWPVRTRDKVSHFPYENAFYLDCYSSLLGTGHHYAHERSFFSPKTLFSVPPSVFLKAACCADLGQICTLVQRVLQHRVRANYNASPIPLPALYHFTRKYSSKASSFWSDV